VSDTVQKTDHHPAAHAPGGCDATGAPVNQDHENFDNPLDRHPTQAEIDECRRTHKSNARVDAEIKAELAATKGDRAALEDDVAGRLLEVRHHHQIHTLLLLVQGVSDAMEDWERAEAERATAAVAVHRLRDKGADSRTIIYAEVEREEAGRAALDKCGKHLDTVKALLTQFRKADPAKRPVPSGVQAAMSSTLSYSGLRRAVNAVARLNGEYAGLPIPVTEAPLVIAKGHPYYDRLHGMQDGEERRKETTDDGALTLVNQWRQNRMCTDVYAMREGGKPTYGLLRHGPMDRLVAGIKCMGVAQTMDVEAERKAMKTLSALIKPHLYHGYEITGWFLETSNRSGVTYIFRRLATTIALRATQDGAGESCKFLAAMCLHPLGYYEGLPIGVMVPTDDVIAHLVMMRSDEHLFWRKSNQHNSWSPGAQL
jgi:hypothetical protein